MERCIGRPLESHEQVHHRNGVKTDNDIQNLQLWSTSHPAGQSIPDKVWWAKEVIGLYGPAFGVDVTVAPPVQDDRSRSFYMG